MPGKYAITGSQDVTTATPGDSALSIAGGTDQRLQLYDFTSGFGGTPADNAITLQVRLHTTAPTGTSVTAQPLDPDDPASRTTCLDDISVEPTVTSVYFEQVINQRATYRWVASPGGEIVVPALANNGILLTSFHASYTQGHEVSCHFVD